MGYLSSHIKVTAQTYYMLIYITFWFLKTVFSKAKKKKPFTFWQIFLIPSFRGESWVLLLASASNLLWHRMSCNLSITPLYSHERMRLKKANNILVLLEKYSGLHILTKSCGHAQVLPKHTLRASDLSRLKFGEGGVQAPTTLSQAYVHLTAPLWEFSGGESTPKNVSPVLPSQMARDHQASFIVFSL